MRNAVTLQRIVLEADAHGALSPDPRSHYLASVCFATSQLYANRHGAGSVNCETLQHLDVVGICYGRDGRSPDRRTTGRWWRWLWEAVPMIRPDNALLIVQTNVTMLFDATYTAFFIPVRTLSCCCGIIIRGCAAELCVILLDLDRSCLCCSVDLPVSSAGDDCV